MALIELDRVIEREIAPLYYGRYVDDIMLVMEDGARFQSDTEIWNWLLKRSNGLLDWNSTTIALEPDGIIFQPKYLGGSEICFSNDKNRIFILHGLTGMALVDSIEREVQRPGQRMESSSASSFGAP